MLQALTPKNFRPEDHKARRPDAFGPNAAPEIEDKTAAKQIVSIQGERFLIEKTGVADPHHPTS